MKTRICAAMCMLGGIALAQSPTPAVSSAVAVSGSSVAPMGSATPMPTATPAVTATATPAVSAAPSATPTATPGASASPAAAARSVKLMFLPPPMEGTISLGIYDHAGKLARVLHREAAGSEFFAALDGYITHWDGLDDAGQPQPPGRYRAGGYLVSQSVTVTEVPYNLLPSALSGTASAALAAPGAHPESLAFPDAKPFVPQEKVHLSLVANPLDRDRAGATDVSIAFDAKGSWLQLAGGLPIKTISAMPNLKWALIGRESPRAPLIVFQSDGQALHEFMVAHLQAMMAFDCGPFDLDQ